MRILVPHTKLCWSCVAMSTLHWKWIFQRLHYVLQNAHSRRNFGTNIPKRRNYTRPTQSELIKRNYSLNKQDRIECTPSTRRVTVHDHYRLWSMLHEVNEIYMCVECFAFVVVNIFLFFLVDTFLKIDHTQCVDYAQRLIKYRHMPK